MIRAKDWQITALSELLVDKYFQINSLKDELNIYKPMLLSLATMLVCLTLWLGILALTGKRKDKIRRLLRRDQFVTEKEEDNASTTDTIGSQDLGSEPDKELDKEPGKVPDKGWTMVGGVEGETTWSGDGAVPGYAESAVHTVTEGRVEIGTAGKS